MRSPDFAWRRWFAVALVAVTLGCDGGPKDGASRPLVEKTPSGVLTLEGREMAFDGEWKKHGEFVFRDPDSGEEIARGAYDRGLENGPWTQHLEGGIVGHGSFRAGERHGPWEYRYGDGRMQEEGAYDSGKRVGRWVARRRDGTLVRVANYANGELDGELLVYGEDGKTLDREASGTYSAGERVGPAGR